MAEGPQRIWLKDYVPPRYAAEHVELTCELDAQCTVITCRQVLRRIGGASGDPLALDGRGFRLKSLAIDGCTPPSGAATVSETGLILHSPADRFALTVVSEVEPHANRSGLGLFLDGPALVTHMEPDGFSRLTYFQDRPDVLCPFDVRLIADPAQYPVLLSNGRVVEQGYLPDGRRFVHWRDETPKPAYIFAVAAGPYAKLSQTRVDGAGRPVRVSVHARPANIGRCHFLLDAILRVMDWDETSFGRFYDNDDLNIVVIDTHAISQENKGLIFLEAAYALADPETSTDEDFDLVERISAHEYLHNWTGDRVTCRDWFQLSVKEGLTRFRDQMFSASVSAPEVKRITTVRNLRTNQFAEDAGAAAHPVQPQSYLAVSNLYTGTVYDKGAEIVRMAHTFLGPARFRAGIDLFFQRHDLSAVTIDELLQALSDGGGEDFWQFRRWYDQAGTPRVRVRLTQDLEQQVATLHFEQDVAMADKSGLPLRIPLRVGLISRSGDSIDLAGQLGENDLVDLKELRQSVDLKGVSCDVVLSCNRGFSAPVIVETERPSEDLALLLAHDVDGFARWDAQQELMIRAVLQLAGLSDDVAASKLAVAAMGKVISDATSDPALAAELLTLPHVGLVADRVEKVDIDRIGAAWGALRAQLASAHRNALFEVFEACAPMAEFSLSAEAKARRRLRSTSLELLLELEEPEIRRLALAEATHGVGMAAQSGALHALCHFNSAETLAAIEAFRERWVGKDDVMRLWFRAQALARCPGAAQRVRQLSQSPLFRLSNTPHSMALLGSFFRQNRIGFHEADGKGYEFLGDTLLSLDRIRPSGTRWLMPQIMGWRRFDDARARLMQAQLQRIASTPRISAALTENIARALAEPRAS